VVGEPCAAAQGGRCAGGGAVPADGAVVVAKTVWLFVALAMHLLQRPYPDDLFNRLEGKLEAFSLDTCLLSVVLLESAVLVSNATVTLTSIMMGRVRMGGHRAALPPQPGRVRRPGRDVGGASVLQRRPHRRPLCLARGRPLQANLQASHKVSVHERAHASAWRDAAAEGGAQRLSRAVAAAATAPAPQRDVVSRLGEESIKRRRLHSGDT